jgi:hypothetical protein
MMFTSKAIAEYVPDVNKEANEELKLSTALFSSLLELNCCPHTVTGIR